MNTKSVLNAAIACAAMTASAATTITVDSVVQRWPWNNKVDITYTVSGGQDLANGNYQKIVFTTVINGVTYTIDGVKDVGASANAGKHTVTWTLPSGVKSTSCTMSAAVYAADAPSGDDYMIIDLTKTRDNVTYEGLLATQDDSNTRYNTAAYKTDKLVLRKVPAGGPYPTGDSVNYPTGDNANTAKEWTTKKDYYIGVFPVTQYQYTKLTGTNPSYLKSIVSGNEVTHRPVECVTWADLRLSTTAPSSPIPAVDSNTGTFFQRLNYITGNRHGFDLPTEVMFEIAERAGAKTAYYWGNDFDPSYVVCPGNSGKVTVAVGSRLPNAWGLYDTAGNVWEWCLDVKLNGDLALRPDAFTPAVTGVADQRRYRGGASWSAGANTRFHASARGSYNLKVPENDIKMVVGFRVARIVD